MTSLVKKIYKSIVKFIAPRHEKCYQCGTVGLFPKYERRVIFIDDPYGGVWPTKEMIHLCAKCK